MTILTLQKYYNEILIFHSIYNVLNGIARFLQYFRNLSNSFINILAQILSDKETMYDFVRHFLYAKKNTNLFYSCWPPFYCL